MPNRASRHHFRRRAWGQGFAALVRFAFAMFDCLRVSRFVVVDCGGPYARRKRRG